MFHAVTPAPRSRDFFPIPRSAPIGTMIESLFNLTEEATVKRDADISTMQPQRFP